MSALHYPLADLALAQRLEQTEAAGCLGFVEARARLTPETGATWRKIGGTFAMFDGPASPITQTFNLGMRQPVEAGHFDEMEAFYHERESPVFHEVSPLADATALTLLTARGYRPIEFTSVMYRPIELGTALDEGPSGALSTRRMQPDEVAAWIDASVAGWDQYAPVADTIRALANVNAHRSDMRCYLVERDGQLVATGGLVIHEDVALLAGASTLVEARGRGAQLSLLAYRLRDAAKAGCTLAMMCALPGSGSQRNAERHGFRIAYTRIKWQLDA